MLICVIIAFAAAPPTDTRTIEDLIGALGSDDYATREEATRRLMRRQDSASLLQSALLDADPEVKRRAGRILASLRAERAGETTQLAAKLLRAGRLDLAAELLVENRAFDRESGYWSELFSALSQVARTEENRSGRPTLQGGPDAWLKGLDSAPNSILNHSPGESVPKLFSNHVVFSNGFSGEYVARCAIFSPTSARPARLRTMWNSLIVTGGSAEFAETSRSVIVCGGNASLPGGAKHCIVIARGRVEVDGPLLGCSILSHEAVTLDRPSHARPSTLLEHVTVIRAHQRGSLGGIRFFELDEFGLVMAKGTDVARAVLPGVYRDAGLRPGDRIVSVGGEKAAHAEAIRTLFIRHFLRPGPVFLKVKRGGESRTLYVNIPEPLKAP